MSSLPVVLGYQVAAVHWPIPDQDKVKQNERDFVQERMQQSNCTRVASRDIAILRRRLHTHLVELAHAAGSRRIVILVDEAQNLTHPQYGHLIHCFNALEQLGVFPFFLLVGQPELRNTPENWAEAKGMQVLGRFFAREFCYRGVQLKDLALVFDTFDIPEEGESESALAAAFPNAYASGWRLKNLAPIFDEAIQIVMREHNISTGLRLPMQYLRSSLLCILHRAIDEHIPLELLSSAVAVNAVKESGFLTVLSYYVDSSSSGFGDGSDKVAA